MTPRSASASETLSSRNFRRCTSEPLRTDAGIGYYRTAAFKIILCSDGAESELGDGGFTAWTATLTADAKERCLISCISSERLAQLAKR